MAKEIILTKGKVAIVDDEDFERLSENNWFFISSGYPARMSNMRFDKTEYKKGRMILMHRELINASNGLEVDHIDNNKLNNQKSNLRLCTGSQNNCNKEKKHGCVSKYKGVRWDKSRNKWTVAIKKDRKYFNLGRFPDEIIAAKVYDEAARKYHGEFARLNFP